MWCCFVVFVCLCLVWICFWCGVLLFGGVCLVVSLALLTRPWVPKYGSYYGRLNGCHYRHDERSVGSKKNRHMCSLVGPCMLRAGILPLVDGYSR